MADTPSPDISRPPASQGISRGLVLLFAVACGISVANAYYAQPILHTIADSFGTTSGTAGLIVTLTQIGFATGLALLIPAGDIVSRKRLAPIVLAVAAAGQVVSAEAPGIGVMIGVAWFVGLGAVAAQFLVPMAASLADDDHRGEVVGTVMTGLLVGILLARTLSGLIAGLVSWRAVYFMAAGLTLIIAVVLRRVLPEEDERPTSSYRSLLASTAKLLIDEPTLRLRSWFGALGFAAFGAFWTTMAFLLAGPPFHYGDITIGLFGLVGAAGAMAANRAGRWADRDLTRTTTMIFALCVALSFLPLWYGRHSLVLLVVGILVLDVGVQGLQVTNQSIIYRLRPDARSRITSAYMVCYFVGGAVGSALGAALYNSDGWTGLCLLGAGIGCIATVTAVLHAGLRWRGVPAPSPART